MSQKTHDDDNDHEEDHARKEKPDPAVLGLTAAPSGDHPRASHTPGPWRVFEAKDRHGRTIIVREGIYEVALACPTASSPASGARYLERDANACLIAAAPDLLAAVKAARAELDALGKGTRPPIMDPMALMRLYEAAIAKAEGRS